MGSAPRGCHGGATVAPLQWVGPSWYTPASMGQPITMTPTGLLVPNDPILPYVEGDGIGPDIWAAAVRVFDAAVAKA